MMILLVGTHTNLPVFVLLGVIIVGLGLLLRYLRQPYVIAYILAGVLLGEHGFKLITDEALIGTVGEFGLMLLLFFIGMETDLSGLIKNWRLAVIGTIFQILGSILLVWLIGALFDWQLNRVILLGFVISLSSSAVVIKLLQDNDEAATLIGKNVISILLVQDILIVPMLIATNYLGGAIPPTEEIVLQLVGGGIIIGGMIWVLRQKQLVLPFSKQVEEDHELQVFVALIVCFGAAALTAFFGLSPALGAFVGGLIVHSAKSTTWFHDSLHSFRVIFVALFFVSIGMLIDLQFLIDNWVVVVSLILAVCFSNHFINAVVLRFFGNDWKSSLYGGALLAQVGELSFVLAASAFQTEIISDFAYKLAILVISLSLLISPFWIILTKKILGMEEGVTKAPTI